MPGRERANYSRARERMVRQQIAARGIRAERVLEAMRSVPRHLFVPLESRHSAYLDGPLSIGQGQTISQPLTVAFMLEQLQPEPENKILDIGSGSGWTTALLAQIVGSKGKVIAIERIPELFDFGKGNVAKYNFIEKGLVEFFCADGSKGYPDFAACPEFAEGFDKILASASAEHLPEAWKKQLKIEGRIVTPIGSSVWLFIKKTSKDFEEIEYPGFAFVPLITK